jgi:flagellar hook-length control protein FliK
MSPIALPNTAPAAPALAGKTARGGSGDDFPLNELLLAPDLALAPGTVTPGPVRLKLAGGGKSLPDGQDTKRKGKDTSGNSRQEADPLFGWITAMFAPQPIPVGTAITASAATTTPTPIAFTDATATPANQSGEANAQAGTPITTPKVTSTPALDPATVPTFDINQAIQSAVTSTDKAVMTPAAATPAQANNPSPAPTAVPAAAQTGNQPPSPTAQQLARPSQTAAQVFATAILATQGRKTSDRDPTKPDPQIAALQSASSTPTDAVKASEANHQTALDLRQDTGLKAMIDHIETLRDNADATDTRVRLTPAGLGTVDVAVRKDGDTVHVHFSAEQPETRSLLADSQPKLSALAQERGIRLGETSVSGGAADPNRQSPQQLFTTEPAAPQRAQSIQSDAADSDGDGRIA